MYAQTSGRLHKKYNQENLNLNQLLILAHRNSDVAALNKIARAKRILAGEVKQGIVVNIDFFANQRS
jgi:hypothetical protein